MAGATLQLSNQKNEVVAEWVSTTEAKVFEQLPHGTYTLSEVAAPSQFQTFEPITFELTDKNEVVKLTAINELTQLEILKKDTLGNLIEGAHLQLLDEKGTVIHEWVSEEQPLLLTGLPHGTYILKEVAAPSGYVKTEDITFKVTDERGTQSIEMIDEWTQISIQKVDHLNQPLAGATLQLIALTTSLADVPTTLLPEDPIGPMPEGEEPEFYEVIVDEWFTDGEPRTSKD